MADVTIKQVDDELLGKLCRRASQRGISVDALIKQHLSESIQVPESGARTQRARGIAGSWTLADELEFIHASLGESTVETERRV